ncbi:MAG: Oligopeptide-binding protein AppA [Gemmatimonadaceae bacterium]|nr:Oligopeptide-binding protein AppA [Gemmatimonadaceae bacterium]
MKRATACLVAAIAGFILASCGEPTARPNALRLPLINDPVFNPIIAADLGSILPNKIIFSGLVRPDENLRPTPDLAESWTESADGLTYTFKLRPGVYWHDGTPFSAVDVKFTFDRIADSTSGSRLRSDFAAVARTEVVDSLTVRFHLKAPFAPFLALLGYNAGIVPAHAFTGTTLSAATDFNRSRPIGTGPFRVTESIPGSVVVLERNPRYYRDPPALDRVIFKVVPDINVQVAQLRAGEMDIVQLEPANLASVQDAKDVAIVQTPVVQHYYVAFNADNRLFSPPDVRRALGMAVNRQAIIDGVLKGYGDLPRGTIPAALKDFFADSLPPVPYAPDSARALLALAGWTPGPDSLLRNARGEPFRFALLVDKGNPTREQSALAVQQDLRYIGIDVTIQTMEFASVVRDFVVPGKFEANLIWWTTPPDPDQFGFYATGQDNNNVRYSNRRVDSLLALGRATRDPAQRREIYRAFQAEEQQDPPVLVLFYPREILAVSAALRGMPALTLRDALRWSERLRIDNR